MNLYKNYCLYNELEKYINDNMNNIIKINNYIKEDYNADNINIIYDYLKSNNYLQKFENKRAYEINKAMFDIKI